jgi:hypothetical protein
MSRLLDQVRESIGTFHDSIRTEWPGEIFSPDCQFVNRECMCRVSLELAQTGLSWK